jgi:hypothetical protein
MKYNDLIINLPQFCYRKELPFQDRLFPCKFQVAEAGMPGGLEAEKVIPCDSQNRTRN